MKVILDGDGVVFDLEITWIRFASEVLGRRLAPTAGREYRFHKRYDITVDEEIRVWRAFDEHGMWGRVDVFKGAVGQILRLRRAGIHFVMVTGISEDHAQLRAGQLGNLGVPMPVVGSGYQPSKLPTLRGMHCEAMVDDRLRCLGDAREAGIPTRILIDRGTVEPDEPAFEEAATHRANSLLEAGRVLFWLLQQKKRREAR